MKLGRTNRAPSFAWQAALILLPVLVLAIIGFLSLQQDKLLAQQEAVERARGIAQTLAAELWQRFAGESKPAGLPDFSFETDERGELLVPPPYAQLPEPVREPHPDQLNPGQLRLWTEARRRLASGDVHATTNTVWDLVESAVPESLAGQLCYELGVRMAEAGDQRAARDMFRAVVQRFPSAVGETGLPLLPLASLKLFWLQKTAPGASSTAEDQWVTVERLCEILVGTPSLMTPLILSELAKEAPTRAEQEEAHRWLARWNDQETARKLHAAAQPYLARHPRLRVAPSNMVYWVTLHPAPPPMQPADVNWLVILQSVDNGTNRFTCRPESRLGSMVKEMSERAGLVPDYLGVSMEVAGRRVEFGAPRLEVWKYENYMTRGGGGLKKAYVEGQRAELLASASGSGAGSDTLNVAVYLTSPTTLLKRQETRGFWFRLLIAASMASALVGLAAAYRAFDRQLRLNAAKTNFVSSVSHELRAPIASVRLMTESLERGRIPDPQRQKEYFRLMHQECRRLSSLVENVLDLSRIEQGRKQYEFEPTDLPALMRETVELMRPRAAERAVALETSLSGVQDEPVLAPVLDGKAIQQALVNLLDNAVKHSREGQRVTAGLELATPTEDRTDGKARVATRLLLWVEDQGEGIPPEDHERIFEQFYRRGSELTRQTQGIGIGLSIVKHIVEAHKGRVLVRSAVGQGSRFTIELPITPAAAQ
jgi:signal transduction histidine kinase